MIELLMKLDKEVLAVLCYQLLKEFHPWNVKELVAALLDLTPNPSPNLGEGLSKKES
jgi:hypothetical protein